MVGPPPESWAVDPAAASAREVCPGLVRLRLPTPWPQISHANAYAIEGVEGGLVLVDAGCGGHPSGLDALENALGGCGHALADVTDLVVTHFHSDHFGSGARVAEDTGCEVWAAPDDEHFQGVWRDPDRYLAERERLARRLGVAEVLVPEMADVREETDGIDGELTPTRLMQAGTTIPTALGDWEVVETPGHAPSQVCLHLAERSMLIAGDVVGPVLAPFFDLGFSADPVAQHLASLRRLEALGLAVILPGHGRPLDDPPELLRTNVAGIEERVGRLEHEIRTGPGTGWELFVRLHGDQLDRASRVWRMWETAAYLDHLVYTGRIVEETAGPRASRFQAVQRPSSVSGA